MVPDAAPFLAGAAAAVDFPGAFGGAFEATLAGDLAATFAAGLVAPFAAGFAATGFLAGAFAPFPFAPPAAAFGASFPGALVVVFFVAMVPVGKASTGGASSVPSTKAPGPPVGRGAIPRWSGMPTPVRA
jgi:hypothetical protein